MHCILYKQKLYIINIKTIEEVNTIGCKRNRSRIKSLNILQLYFKISIGIKKVTWENKVCIHADLSNKNERKINRCKNL